MRETACYVGETMQITVGNVITVEHPSPELLHWCEKNLTLSNPEYAKKMRMGFWVGNTPKTLCLYEIRGGKLIIPYGCLKEIAPFLAGAAVQNDLKPPVNVDYGEPIPLYPYQQKAVDEAVRGLYGIIQSRAGSGKTQIGIALIREYGRRALWLTHTADLFRQSKERAERYMDRSLIGTITEGKVNIGKGVTFATIQTMCRLDLAQYKDMWDVIVVDECFPAGTLIQTPHGNIPIKYIVPGELVLTRNEKTGKLELCRVGELQIRRVNGKLVRLTTENGESVVCTDNHPFLTPWGYCKAGDLTHGDQVYLLRKGFRPGDMEPYPKIRHSERGTISLLFQRMFKKRSSHAFGLDGRTKGNFSEDYAGDESRVSFRTNEAEQPLEESRSQAKDISLLKSHESPPFDSRGERSRLDCSADAFSSETFRFSSIDRVCDSDWEKKSRLFHALQNRHRFSFTKGSDRSGRLFSLRSESANRRYQENGVFKWVRVESVEVFQSECDKRFRDLCPDGCVYNLAVNGNHNYFANGFAVHNCHRVAGTPTAMTQFYRVLNSLSARHKYGLSATVHRSDGMIAATYALLGNVVYTVPDEAVADRVMRVGIKPVGTGVKISRECLNTDGTLNYTKLITYLTENAKRNKLIADSIERRPSLILSDRLNHLEEIMDLLPTDMRKDAAMISGKMTSKSGKAEREKAIEDMRTGRKKYLFATYSLCKEGLDIPCLERLYMATPQKDYAVITQSIGRIARTCDGKEAPVCYDFVDNAGYPVKAYKKRCSIYRKNGCYFVEEALE